ncbi:MAG: sigma-70 family RNA polymerase sigma factor [Bacteroidota bacterium]
MKQNRKAYLSQFEALFKAHFAALHRYGWQFSGDRDLAKDAIQTLFLQLWEKQIDLTSVDNWSAYLRTALRRQLLHDLKKRQKDTSIEQPLIELSYEDLLIQSQTNQQRRQQLQAALQQLPLIEKEMLEARFLQGMSYDEIAQLKGKSKQTVYNQIYTAIKKLRKVLIWIGALVNLLAN